MLHKFSDEFCWMNFNTKNAETLSDNEKYQLVIDWASKARGQNPNVFDSVSEWLLDDNEWTEDKLIKNKQTLMQGILARFKEQNDQLRAFLKSIKNPDYVNAAVWKALDEFDDELSGHSHDNCLKEAVEQIFSDFSVIRERSVREKIAGGKTGSAGVNTVDFFGYINRLENLDAGVQWALFMPQMVERQQNGFKLESFEYKRMPPMRFIGKECIDHDPADMRWEKELFSVLDTLTDYKSGLDYDVLLMHHYGKGVDVENCHAFWGRFMTADTPVPEGFIYVDFIPQRDINSFVSGPPYFSQFAYSSFSGDMQAMHKREGYDCDAMYDITRNIMLGQGINIPYPDKYWTAEVFVNGFENYSTAYMFSAEL